MILSKAKISSKFQITIPIRIVKKLNLHPGETISFAENIDKIEIIPDTKTFSAESLTKKYQHVSSVKAATPREIKTAFEKGLSARSEN